MTETEFRRSAVLDQDVDSASGTMRLSFASEIPVLRETDKGSKYYEVLSHAPGDVNLGFINRNGMVLQDHDEKQEIGDVVRGSVRVESDKKTRANIKLVDGGWITRTKTDAKSIPVSVGGSLLSIVKRETAPDGIPMVYFSWRPYEISLLTSNPPADDTVGFKRMKESMLVDSPKTATDEKSKTDLTKEKQTAKLDMQILREATPTDGGGVDTEKLKLEAATVERQRVSSISKLADSLIENHGKMNDGKLKDQIRSAANSAVDKDETFKDFQIRAQGMVLNAKPVPPVYVEDCTDEAGKSRYSLVRAIRSCAENGTHQPKDGIELEVHQEYISRSKANGEKITYQGFVIPYHSRIPVDNTRRAGHAMKRDMQASIFASGGAMVPTILQVPYIDLLRNRMALAEAGVRTMGGLTGNVVIPRLEAPATIYSLSEIAAITASQETLGQVSMNPKRCGAQVVYSKQLVFQSTPDIEALIRDDVFKQIAIEWDALGITGTGAGGQPLGILNTPGVGTVTFGAAATYAKIVAFETALRTANVYEPLSYVTTSNARGKLKTAAAALTGASSVAFGSTAAIWTPDEELGGHPGIDTQQVPGDLMIAGAFDNMIHGLWGGLDVVVDQYTAAGTGEIKLTVNTWGDYALRHPQAFCVSTDSAAQ